MLSVIEIDRERDLAYILLRPDLQDQPGVVARSMQVAEDIVLDLDANGQLIKNVGGDFLQPHRQIDPIDRTFLDGILVKTRKVDFITTYEIRNQIWLDAWYEYESIVNTDSNTTDRNDTFGGRIRMEF